jgi:hypothetical protein
MSGQQRRYEVRPIIGSLTFGPIDQTFDNKADALEEAKAILNEQPSVSSLHTVKVSGHGPNGETIFVGFVLRNLAILVTADLTNEP